MPDAFSRDTSVSMCYTWHKRLTLTDEVIRPSSPHLESGLTFRQSLYTVMLPSGGEYGMSCGDIRDEVSGSHNHYELLPGKGRTLEEYLTY